MLQAEQTRSRIAPARPAEHLKPNAENPTARSKSQAHEARSALQFYAGLQAGVWMLELVRSLQLGVWNFPRAPRETRKCSVGCLRFGVQRPARTDHRRHCPTAFPEESEGALRRTIISRSVSTFRRCSGIRQCSGDGIQGGNPPAQSAKPRWRVGLPRATGPRARSQGLRKKTIT
jgi:hypothetical protein